MATVVPPRAVAPYAARRTAAEPTASKVKSAPPRVMRRISASACPGAHGVRGPDVECVLELRVDRIDGTIAPRAAQRGAHHAHNASEPEDRGRGTSRKTGGIDHCADAGKEGAPEQ